MILINKNRKAAHSKTQNRANKAKNVMIMHGRHAMRLLGRAKLQFWIIFI